MGPLAFTVGDFVSAPGDLIVTATSSDQALISDANIVLGGSDAQRTITLTPVQDALGAATITVTVDDGQNTASVQFTITISATISSSRPSPETKAASKRHGCIRNNMMWPCSLISACPNPSPDYNHAMLIAACTIQLTLYGASSLKDKRQILKSILSRLPRQFNVAVAEVDHQDVWQSAVISIVTVGNDAGHLHSTLEHAVAWIERQRPDAPIADYSIEFR